MVPERMILECWRDGALIFAAEASDFVCWGTQRRPGAPLRLNPLALGESTYLFAELARRVYEHAEPAVGAVEFTLTLYRVDPGGEPARLTPGGIKSRAFRFGMDMRRAPEGTVEFIERLEAGWTAGEAAYRLVARVYTWFGFEEDDMPYVVVQGSRGLGARRRGRIPPGSPPRQEGSPAPRFSSRNASTTAAVASGTSSAGKWLEAASRRTVNQRCRRENSSCAAR